MLQNTMLKIAQHGGIDVELPLQVKVSLWVKEGGRLRPDCRPHAETMGGTWASDARDGCRPSPSLSSRPCNGTAASASGQARVGVHEDGRIGKNPRKVNKKEKKKEKMDSPVRTPTKQRPPQAPHEPCMRACTVCCRCGCDSGVWMLVVGGMCIWR